MRNHFIILSCLLLTSCMTPQERAAREQQEAVWHRQRLIDTCQQYGHQFNTPGMAQCMQMVDMQLQQQRAQQRADQQHRAAYANCLMQPTRSGSAGESFTRCNQNPYARPVQTSCQPDVHGNINCTTW